MMADMPGHVPTPLSRKIGRLAQGVLADSVGGLILRWRALRRASFISPAALLRHPQAISVGHHAQVHRGAIVSAQPPYGHRSQSGHVAVGDFVIVREYAIVDAHGGKVVLGAGSFVGAHCVLQGQGGLVIGRQTLLGPRVTIVAAMHTWDDPTVPIKFQPERCQGVLVGDDVWVGAGAVILDGVTIGPRAIVGAGAVVRHSVGSGEIVAGVPARVIGRRS